MAAAEKVIQMNPESLANLRRIGRDKGEKQHIKLTAEEIKDLRQRLKVSLKGIGIDSSAISGALVYDKLCSIESLLIANNSILERILEKL